MLLHAVVKLLTNSYVLDFNVHGQNYSRARSIDKAEIIAK
jgi:hypothetical protein